MTRSIAAVVLASALVMPMRAQEVFAPGDGVSLPTVVSSVRPDYTAQARDAHIEGIVELETVVLADGRVGDVAVAVSLDTRFGLDARAVDAMKQWTFKPGTKDGKPVAVRVHVQMNFTLK